ncbi:glycoside hydrolase family 15 [Ornithinicoccus halotolerans]|uniref:glycoside hydrolase family 15 n=1 Tax=Ornithinicoccus halotolerans TaxID=1748220 RepID=UPI00188630BF|nr:glycoside hydrolase family 15 [Ornithinicoccus halotolerans]
MTTSLSLLVLAAPSANWRFVWPRDAAFVAVGYARTGHRSDALAVLRLLQSQQRADGAMAARWVPDGTGRTPDEREVQEDGPGWALWAVHQVLLTEATQDGRRAVGLQLGPLVTRSTARLLERLEGATGLPAPSPDYWEVPEDQLTLGVAATALMGLEAAAAIATAGVVDPAQWRDADVDPAALRGHADRLRSAVVGAFGPGYPRHIGRGRVDAAVTFLGPPFLAEPLAGAAAARHRAREEMARPAGGVAPGAGWKRDGISWTPETALLGLAAAAAGEEQRARHWLDWLASHRTEAGSLPEKVLHDGSPAAVAPLAWTAALVLLTLAELECADPAGGCPGPPAPPGAPSG